MKKTLLVLSAVLVFTVLTLCLTLSVSAKDVIHSGTLGKLTWTLNETTGNLIISGSGEMESLVDTPAWLTYSNRIKTVTIQNGVTSIGLHAFKDCGNLSKVTIPNSVTTIRYLAFWNCNKLTEITIPNTCTSVNEDAFSGCENIATATIPANAISALPQFGLRHLTITNGTSIPNSAFANETELISITLPKSITSIGDFAFYNCTKLKSIVLPKGVTNIGYQAFQQCVSLESINIPSGVETIRQSTFMGCESLISITLPKNMTTIERRVFDGCKSLTSIQIPSSVVSIESSAFNGCQALSEVVLPDGLLSISDFAFANCGGLKKIVIPNGIQSISGYAFDGTGHIEIAVMPTYAISYISHDNLKTVVFTKGTSISANAFSKCKTLQEVFFCGTESEWKSLQADKSWMKDLNNVVFSYHDCEWNADDDGHTGVCTQCDAKVYAAHTWNAGTVIVTPTHLEEGVEKFSCTVCQMDKETVLEKTKTHTYGSWIEVDETKHKKLCACGEELVSDHVYGAWNVTKHATETSEGQREKTCNCGRKISETIPVLTHEYTAEVIAPTCVDEGYTKHTCKNCGDSYQDTCVAAIGHTYENDQDAVCDRCDAYREIITEQQAQQSNEASDKQEDTNTGFVAMLMGGFGLLILVMGVAVGIVVKKKRI